MHHVSQNPIAKKLMDITSQDTSLCYQCGKCSAGCPLRDFMETPPNRIVRYLQLGLYDLALNSASIWLCAGCQTCSSRCPKNFEIAKLMDALRQISIELGVKPKDDKVLKFHKAFLKQIKNNGRSFKLGLVRDYKLSTGKFFQDLDLAPETLKKGKMAFTPHKIKSKEKIQKIFDKSMKRDTE
jgi:heterodisulfide reductase subunit C2